MLNFFADSYPNELIYSSFARYHFYSGNIELKDTIRELFGNDSVVPSMHCVSHLSKLCSAIGGNYIPLDLIKNNTILPYYFPFISKDQKAKVIEMAQNDGKGLFVSLGIAAGSIMKKNKLMFCPDCVRRDLDELGEVYFHREHQLEGVVICPHDGFLLREYPMENSRVAYTRMRVEVLENMDNTRYKGEFAEFFMKISRAAFYLITSELSSVSREEITNRYKALLLQRGLVTAGGNIRQEELFDVFSAYYSKPFLERLESSINKNHEYCWLKSITRNVTRSVHPLRHILMILFLSTDMELFFGEIGNKVTPFGDAPYPCLNPACKFYRKNIISNVIITPDYKTRQLVGTFICKCGFVYSRLGPDKNQLDRYRIGRTKQFGEVWEAELRMLLSQGLSQNQIALKLHCDPMTVKKYANCTQQKVDTPLLQSGIERYKKRMMDFVSQNTGISRTNTRKAMQKEYIYLYRHDRKWLMEQLPLRLQSKGSKGFVDWEKRDELILDRLENIRTQLFSETKLIRVTATKLMKLSGFQATLEHFKDKLPMCEEFLMQKGETLEAFRLRRCLWWIDYYKKNGIPYKPWVLMRDAGLRKIDFEKLNMKLIVTQNQTD